MGMSARGGTKNRPRAGGGLRGRNSRCDRPRLSGRPGGGGRTLALAGPVAPEDVAGLGRAVRGLHEDHGPPLVDLPDVVMGLGRRQSKRQGLAGVCMQVSSIAWPI